MTTETDQREAPEWQHPRDAASDAVLWGSIEDAAKARKDAARQFVTDALVRDSSRGVDAYAADGTLIGGITRSKPSEKRDVLDWPAFLEWVAEFRPDALTVEYKAKEALLRTLRDVDGHLIDHDGNVVPGVGVRQTSGSVRVTKDPAAKPIVESLIETLCTLMKPAGVTDVAQD